MEVSRDKKAVKSPMERASRKTYIYTMNKA